MSQTQDLDFPTLATTTSFRKRRLHAYWTECCYELVAVSRQLDFSVPTLLFPAMFYLFFGVLFGGGGLSSYLLATYGTFGVIGTALFGFGVGTAVARESGELRLKQVTPMPAGAFLASKIVASFVFSCIVLMELFLLAAILGGVRFEFHQWLSLAGVLLLGTLPFSAFGLAIGTHVSGKGAPAVVNLFYLPMAFLSGLWIPITMLPEFLQKLAFALPPFHLSQLALGTIGLDSGHPWQVHAAVLLAVTFICLGIAARGYRR